MSSSPIELLDDSSSSDGSIGGVPAAAFNPSAPFVGSRQKKKNQPATTTTKPTVKHASQHVSAPKLKTLAPFGIPGDDASSDEDELEVMPRSTKRVRSSPLSASSTTSSPNSPKLFASAAPENNCPSLQPTKRGQVAKDNGARPSLSSTGSSQNDPVDLLNDSSPANATLSLAQRLAKRQEQEQDEETVQKTAPAAAATGAQPKKSHTACTTKPISSGFGQSPSVSLSSPSSASSPCSPSEQSGALRSKTAKRKLNATTTTKKAATSKVPKTVAASLSQQNATSFHTLSQLSHQNSDDDSSSDEDEMLQFLKSNTTTTTTKAPTAKKKPTTSFAASYQAMKDAPLETVLSSNDDDENGNDSTPPSKKRAVSSETLPRKAALKKDDGSSSSSDEGCFSLKSNRTAATTTTATKRKPAARKRTTASNPYSKEQREAEKAEKKRQKEEERAAKQREKEAAKQLREQARREKKEAEARAKQERKRAKEAVGQARGKFANQEVAVLMEPKLLNHGVFDTMKEAFEKEGDAVGGYQLNAFPSALSCLAVQFVRRDYLQGGAEEALKMVHARKMNEFEQLNTLVVVFDCPHDFIDMIQPQQEDDRDGASRSVLGDEDEDDDYPRLAEWLLGLVAGWRAAWKKTIAERPRIYLILYQVQSALDKMWVNYNKGNRGGRSRGPRPPNSEQLHDAILYMLIQYQTEVIHCETKDDVPKELAKVTRFLSNARYRAQTTELACVQKVKAQVSDLAPTYDRAVDCWYRQLRTIPRVSAEMARCFCRYYPTLRSLWLAYQDTSLTVDEKQVLVADCFGTRATQIKLSRWLYRIFTSQNPDELLT